MSRRELALLIALWIILKLFGGGLLIPAAVIGAAYYLGTTRPVARHGRPARQER